MESLTVKADLVNLDMVLDFAKRILEKQNAPGRSNHTDAVLHG